MKPEVCGARSALEQHGYVKGGTFTICQRPKGHTGAHKMGIAEKAEGELPQLDVPEGEDPRKYMPEVKWDGE